LLHDDRIPFMACAYEQHEFLFLFEPHEGFDYDEFIRIVKGDLFNPKFRRMLEGEAGDWA